MAPSWRWNLGFWCGLSLLGAFAVYANAQEAGDAISVGRALWLGQSPWLIWAPLTALIVRLGQRWPIDRTLRWRYVAGHLAAAGVAGGVAAAVTAAFVYHPDSAVAFARHVGSRVVTRAPMGSTLYVLILGVSYLVINTRRMQDEALRSERLSRALTEAQLGALRAQLHPHFLFNGLNAVMALVRDGATERADRALVLLSDVLRTTLRQGLRQRIPFSEELTFIRHYLEIETLRFGDRLCVTYAIAPDVGGAWVPPFILQPLVENALQHGLLNLADGGTLRIEAARLGATLTLSVADDGVGLPGDWETRASRAVGILNVRARLNHMYGDAARLAMTAGPGGTGTCARVDLPFEAGR